MRGKRAIFILGMLAGFVPASAVAMSAPAPQSHCRVLAGEKLPAASGGPAGICSAIESAVAAAAPNARFSAEVTVLTPSMLSTSLQVNGRTLPEQKFAVMDRELNEASVKRFANSVAATVAQAAKP
jgi:hypothetical protein